MFQWQIGWVDAGLFGSGLLFLLSFPLRPEVLMLVSFLLLVRFGAIPPNMKALG